jgi:His/Glu/Gln/Arg/opine family amino acid ABC transporter permease subunit
MQQLVENYFNLAILSRSFPELLRGFGVTVQVALATIVLGVGLGLVLAVTRAFAIKAVNALIVVYVDLFRTLPQLVVIICVYFALPYAGITLSPFAATVLALGAVLSAFATEAFWAGILAIPRGQWDAAHSLGLRFLPIIFKVILPQAIRLAIPLLTNRAIAITKGTALGTAVSLPEVLGAAQSATAIAANPSPLTLAAAFYLLFFIPLVIASRRLEARYLVVR